MGLGLHIVRRDKFELDQPNGGFNFPCFVCTHRHGTDIDEPCRTCDYNANAAEEDICHNCDTALPDGCGGVFRSDGKSCRLNEHDSPAAESSEVGGESIQAQRVRELQEALDTIHTRNEQIAAQQREIDGMADRLDRYESMIASVEPLQNALHDANQIIITLCESNSQLTQALEAAKLCQNADPEDMMRELQTCLKERVSLHIHQESIYLQDVEEIEYAIEPHEFLVTVEAMVHLAQRKVA